MSDDVLEVDNLTVRFGATEVFRNLSFSGQFQRLLIAFALAGNPNVLLLDEPTAGVDEPGEERLNELVLRHAGRVSRS